MTAATRAPACDARMRRWSATAALNVTRAVAADVWRDGFIYAGNLAYMAMLALFPFFVLAAAIFSAVGEAQTRINWIDSLLRVLPDQAAEALEPVADDVITMRHGWLLAWGAVVALWTVSSLIETIRDLLHRSYHAPLDARQWWRDRLAASGMAMVAVVVLLIALYLQVALSSILVVIHARFPQFASAELPLGLYQLVPTVALFGSIYLLFLGLTPAGTNGRGFPKWPGALLVTLWWGVVATVLPVLLRQVLHYNLTYGSLAGVMITLFFFWLVGVGMVAGAELNAELARGAMGETKV